MWDFQAWVVWTDKSPLEIHNMLVPHILNEDNMLIVPIDASVKQGWMPKWVWDWFDSKQHPNPLGGIGGLGLRPTPNPFLTGALGNPLFPKK
jgi:hypothetical protein